MKRRAILLGTGALLFGFGGYLLWGRRRFVDARTIQRRAEAIGVSHGILIGYGPPDTFVVPPYASAEARIEGRVATQVKLTALPPALAGIEQSLRIYPPGFFARLCKAIFLCGSLTYEGVQAGGTYGKAWIILVANEEFGEDGIFQTARLGVHHEFSSLLWKRMPTLQISWATLLPSGWQPVQSAAHALWVPERGFVKFADGFLSPYGTTSVENDFNVYAEILFTDPRRVIELAAEYDVIARKAALLMTAYAKLDRRLISVFQSLGLEHLLNVPPSQLEERGVSVSPITIPLGEIIPR